MADEFTTRLNLTKPEVGASDETWGNKLNDNADAIDAAVVMRSGDTVTGNLTFDAAGTIMQRPEHTIEISERAARPFRILDSAGSVTHVIAAADITGPSTPSLAQSILTRVMGDGRYMQPSWTITAGDGLSGGGNGSANRTLAVDGTVVRTSRTLTAGDGLTGGGNLNANRTFAVDTAWLSDRAVPPSRQISTGVGLTGGGNLSSNRALSLTLGDLPYAGGVNYSAPRVIAIDGADNNTQVRLGPTDLQTNFGLAPASNSIRAGNGMITSGTLGNDPAVAIGTPSSITLSSTNSASGNTHSHELPQAAFRLMMANYITPGQIGSMCLMYRNNSISASPGTTANGSTLYFTDAGSNTSTEGGSASGTWVCCGYLLGTSHFQERKTQWLRVS